MEINRICYLFVIIVVAAFSFNAYAGDAEDIGVYSEEFDVYAQGATTLSAEEISSQEIALKIIGLSNPISQTESGVMSSLQESICRKDVTDRVQTVFDNAKGDVDITDGLVHSYTSNFTVEQLEDIYAFFSSPSGVEFTKKIEAISHASAPYVMKFSNAYMAQVTGIIAEGECVPGN